MGLKIPCPHCGPRPFLEFAFGGEVRGDRSPGPEEVFRRVYLRTNAPGPQRERWFHAFGCRRWLVVRRDTVTNRIDPDVGDGLD